MRHRILLACLPLCAAAAAAGIPTIHCPADPPAIRTVNLVERWRLNADEVETPLIGLVQLARCAEPGGDIYLLDRQLCQVHVYGADGEYRLSLGNEGDGPGEFRRPNGFRVLADGTLAIKAGWPSRLVFLHPDGEPAGRWQPDADARSIIDFAELPGGWIISGQKFDDERRDGSRMVYLRSLSRYDKAGVKVHEYQAAERVFVRQPPTTDEHQPYFPSYQWGLTPAAELVVSAARGEYRLEVSDLDGNLLRVIERDLPPYRRTEADLAEIRRTSRAWADGRPQETVFRLLDTEPVISNLSVRPDGSLWVFTCYADRELPDGVCFRYDVHAPDGTLVEEMRLVGEYDSTYDRLQLLGDGRAVILRNYRAAVRNFYNSAQDDDPVREDSTFEIIVCDLRDPA